MKYQSIILDRKMTFIEKAHPDRKIFKIRYDSTGNHFLILIIGTSEYAIYSKTNIKPNKRTVPASV